MRRVLTVALLAALALAAAVPVSIVTAGKAAAFPTGGAGGRGGTCSHRPG